MAFFPLSYTDFPSGEHMDEDGYPTEEELTKIKEWKIVRAEPDGIVNEIKEFYAYLKSLWRYSDCGYWEEKDDGTYELHTGGWSGNESIIQAMQENKIFWIMHWYQSRRGGHYIFK